MVFICPPAFIIRYFMVLPSNMIWWEAMVTSFIKSSTSFEFHKFGFGYDMTFHDLGIVGVVFWQPVICFVFFCWWNQWNPGFFNLLTCILSASLLDDQQLTPLARRLHPLADAPTGMLWPWCFGAPFWVEKLKVDGKLYIILTYFIDYY